MLRGGFLAGSALAVALAVGCGDQGDPARPTSSSLPERDAGFHPVTDAGDGGDVDAGDAGDAAVPREEIATGTRIVTHPAILGGVTSDGFVLFIDLDADKHTTAKIVPLAGGAETTLVASTGSGKDDLRYAIAGKVVFVWSDRGSRVATLTMWSEASGVVKIGPNVRPGRAAATSDGKTVLYVRDVTDAGASVVAGPIDGAKTTIGTLNAADDDCWRNVDLSLVGAGAEQRLVARYCPDATKAFSLRTFDPATKATSAIGSNVTSAAYGGARLVWAEGGGTLKSAAPDGTALVILGSDAAEYALAPNQAIVAYRTKSGAIATVAPDGGPAKTVANDAVALGAVSPHARALLFATAMTDAGATDVQALNLEDGGKSTIVAKPTSCPNCLFDSFSDDETRVLVIDPLAKDGTGPVRIADLFSGATIATTTGRPIVTAAAYGDAGATQRFVFLDSTPDPSLGNGASFGITTRGLAKAADAKVIAKGVENVEVEIAKNLAVFSFAGTGDKAGVWVAPLE